MDAVLKWCLRMVLRCRKEGSWPGEEGNGVGGFAFKMSVVLTKLWGVKGDVCGWCCAVEREGGRAGARG